MKNSATSRDRGERGRQHHPRQIKLYDNPDWAKPYDVIVHNECFADTDDLAYVQKITAAHKAASPRSSSIARCTYRAAKFDDWRELLGVTSRRTTKSRAPFP